MIDKITQFASCPLMNMHNIYRYSGVKMVEQESLSNHIVEVQIMGYMILNHLNFKYGEGIDSGVFLEKVLHHDLEESLTGDVSRPLKYHNSKILHELKDVAKSTASILYSKYFDDSLEMLKLWDTAKEGKEGILIKIVDMLVVATKALREVELLGNNYFLKVVYEVKTYLKDVYESIKSNSPYNEESTKYLLHLINDSIEEMNLIWNKHQDIANEYKILDNTLLGD